MLHCVSSLDPAGGGPSRSVPALARAIARRGAAVSVAYVGHSPPQTLRARGGVDFVGCRPSALGLPGSSTDLSRLLGSGRNFDLYHGHGLWEMPVHRMAAAARRQRRPYILAPRGMLEPWALAHSGWKKRLAGWAFQNGDLRRADCLHALNSNEAGSLRGYGLRNPIAVIGNGVDVPDREQLAMLAPRLVEMVPAGRGRPVALFLSRLHPKKGLSVLLQAWAEVHPQFSDWSLVVAGPGEGAYRADAELRVSELGLQGTVVFVGPLYASDKLAAYAGADLFVLPSFSEGFSMAVLEAMACGLPVLITPGCNFPEVARKRTGVVAEPEAGPLAAALREVMSMTAAQRLQMGARGRRLVEAEYEWAGLAERMIEVYEWLLGRRPTPSCVVTD